jgi:hypothetical protein
LYTAILIPPIVVGFKLNFSRKVGFRPKIGQTQFEAGFLQLFLLTYTVIPTPLKFDRISAETSTVEFRSKIA